MPSSFITAMASGLTRPGFVPALSTSKRSPASCSSNPSAIWLRAEFPVQRIKTRFFMVLVVEENLLNLGAAAGHAARRTGLGRSNKGTDELALDLSCQIIDIEAAIRQKGSRIVDIVNPRGLDIDVVKTGFGELVQIILLAQGPSDTTRPEFHALLDFGRYVAPNHHIRDSKTTARFEHTKSFFEYTVLVTGKIDDAVRDDDIHRLVGKRDVFDFAFKKLDIS